MAIKCPPKCVAVLPISIDKNRIGNNVALSTESPFNCLGGLGSSTDTSVIDLVDGRS